MSKMLSLVACVFGLGFAVNAATPVAIWEGNFEKPISGFTLDLNGNAVSADGIATIGTAGGIKIGFSEKMPNGITVMIRYINLQTSQDQALMTVNATQDGTAYANFVGLRLSENNGTQGIWKGEPWGDTGAYSFSATSGTLVLTYYHTDGTYAYHLANGVRSPLYGSTGLKGYNGHPTGVNVGGKDSGWTATGMQIAGIALFDSVLGASEMTSMKWTMPLNLGWNGSAWTNAVGTVVAPTVEHTLVMRDGDVIAFSSVTTPAAVQLPEEGHVTISGQNNLQGVTIDIPNGCTLEMTSNADLGANGVTGNGTLAYNPGGVNATVISTGKLANFTGTFWMKSGRHAYANAIASSVTLKVTDGAQLWPTGGTWGNVFQLSGQGWVNPEGEFQNDIEHAAMRLDAGVTLSADAWLLFVKGEDGKTPTIGTIAEKGARIASHMMGVDGFEKRGSGPITLTDPKTQAEYLTGECVVATGVLQIGNNAGFSAGDTVKIGSGITVNDGATLNVWCWTGGATSANTNDMVHVANDITIKSGGTLQTVDGAYDFQGKVTAHDGARGRFVYRRGWAFANLVIPSGATFDAVVAGDDSNNVYLSVLGGDVKGTLRVTNEGEDRTLHHYEMRVALSGAALADGTIDFSSPKQKSWIVLVGDASLGDVTGDTAAAFGDGVATRNLTLTGDAYTITFKGVDKGTEQFDKLNLVIDGDVTLNGKGTSSTCSGTTTVKSGATLKFVDLTALPSGALILEGGTLDLDGKDVAKVLSGDGTVANSSDADAVLNGVVIPAGQSYEVRDGLITIEVKEGEVLTMRSVPPNDTVLIYGEGRVEYTNATALVALPEGLWGEEWTGTFALGGCGSVEATDWDIASYYNGTNSVFEFGVVREGSAISYDKVTGGYLRATASPVELGELRMVGKITLTSGTSASDYHFTVLSGTRTLTINGAVALGRGRSPSAPSPALSFGDVSDFTGEIRCPDGAIHLVGEVLFGNATLVATNGVIVHSNAVVRLVDATAEKQRIMKVQGCTTTFEEGSALVMDNRYCQFVSDSPVVVDETVTIPLTLNDTANIDKPLMTWSERPLGYFELLTDVPVEPGQKVYAAQKEPYGLIIVESVYFTFGGTVMPFEEQWLKDAGVWVEGSVEETEENLSVQNENGISPGLAYMLGFAAEDAAGAQYALTITSPSPSTSSLHLITLTIPTADARRNGLRVVNTLEATPDVRDWTNPRIIELKTATTFLDDQAETGAPQQFYRVHGQIIRPVGADHRAAR